MYNSLYFSLTSGVLQILKEMHTLNPTFVDNLPQLIKILVTCPEKL